VRKYLIFLLISCMLLSGCQKNEGTPAPLPSSNPTPGLSPKASPEIKSTVSEGNPIKLFFNAYLDFSEPVFQRFYEGIRIKQDLQALEASLFLSELTARLSEVRISLSRLSADESSTPLMGAVSGIGSINYEEEAPSWGACSFVFNYDDGKRMEGSFDGRALSYAVNFAEVLEAKTEVDDGIQPEGEADTLLGPMGLGMEKEEEIFLHFLYSLLLSQQNGGYFACVDDAKNRYGLFVSEEKLELFLISLDENEKMPPMAYEESLEAADWSYTYLVKSEK